MEYFGTIFVAVIAFVLGYVLGRIKSKPFSTTEKTGVVDEDGFIIFNDNTAIDLVPDLNKAAFLLEEGDRVTVKIVKHEAE